MDQPIPKGLQVTFFIHAIAGLVLGLALLLVPGRSLNFLGWVPDWVQLPNSEASIPGQTFVDPLITRLLGAALLALAYLSFRCWVKAARSIKETLLIVEFEVVYCALSIIAIIPTMITLNRPSPLILWVCLLVFAAFLVAWGLALRAGKRQAM